MDTVAVKVCKMDGEVVERQNFLEEACKYKDYLDGVMFRVRNLKYCRR